MIHPKIKGLKRQDGFRVPLRLCHRGFLKYENNKWYNKVNRKFLKIV